MWVGGDEEEGAAVLLEASARRGVDDGRGGAWRCAAVRSGITGREGKREPEEGERSRGRGEVRGGRSGRHVASSGRRGGSRRWPGEAGGGRGSVGARRAPVRPPG